MESRPVVNRVGVPEFDTMDAATAEALVRPCCASERWVAYLIRKRPHHTLGHLLAASDDAVRALDWPDVEQALGPLTETRRKSSQRRRDPGRGRAGHDPTIDVRSAPQSELQTATLDYQRQFGHPFLNSGPGASTSDVLHQLRTRLGHTSEVERLVVRAELRTMARLGLTTTFCGPGGT